MKLFNEKTKCLHLNYMFVQVIQRDPMLIIHVYWGLWRIGNTYNGRVRICYLILFYFIPIYYPVLLLGLFRLRFQTPSFIVRLLCVYLSPLGSSYVFSPLFIVFSYLTSFICTYCMHFYFIILNRQYITRFTFVSCM